MSARIARGSSAAARRPAARSAPSRKRKGKKKQPGLLESLPVSPQTLRVLLITGAVLALLIVAAATAAALRLPQKAGTALSEQVGAAGFTLRHLELRGNDRVDAAAIRRVVYGQPSLAMPLVDLDAVRSQLMAFAWIKDARVSRRLPDTLVVDVVERRPVAVWQHNRQLSLIDDEGVRLAPVRLDAVPNLPLVIGPGAERRVAALGALLDSAPRLKPLLAGATWIGGRRWDLRFHTGETLSLPEGDDPPRRALRRFAEMDERRQLLGGNFLRFDMRIEDRMIVRVRPGADGRAPTLTNPDPGQPPQDLARTI